MLGLVHCVWVVGAGLQQRQHVHAGMTCSSFELALARSFVLVSIVLVLGAFVGLT